MANWELADDNINESVDAKAKKVSPGGWKSIEDSLCLPRRKMNIDFRRDSPRIANDYNYCFCEKYLRLSFRTGK